MERMDEVARSEGYLPENVDSCHPSRRRNHATSQARIQLRYVPFLFGTFLICLRVACERIRIRK